ncbi:MAG: hypothetical protein K6T61_03745 [Bryobacteraceae bacterium]|nr:hypothetical protein [Bryobacteraceae bacterium]
MQLRFFAKSLSWPALTLAVWAMTASAAPVPHNPVWPRPVVTPRPATTAGVQQPVVSLDGVWKVSVAPPAEFWSNAVDPSSWQEIRIPSHAVPQGVIQRPGGQFAFKKRVMIPAEFAGKRILLQFDGVSGEGKAWVNGVHLRDHYGAFTTWDCDITEHVTPGKEAWITVAATNANDGLSGYNNGGILRSVRLMALPQDYVFRFNAETDLDRQYRDAVLKVWVGMRFHQAAQGRVQLTLRDPAGRAVPLKPSSVELSRQAPEAIVEVPVAAPLKWDAEHPNLYTLEAAVTEGGAVRQTVVKRIGFRKVERLGKRLLVNGKEVKLRGVCRKDIYPLTGRSVPLDLMEEDVRLFRLANVNYVRTSHYPTNQEFLEACDRLGMYVESENSISFARGAVASNPEFTARYLNQLAEMIEKDRSHPSIIIWSLGNESNWGTNVLKSAQYARAEDPSRLLKFSWSHLVPPEHYAEVQDLHSFHYPSTRRDLAAGGPVLGANLEPNRERGTDPTDYPVLHDEWAHVPVYITADLRRDPGIRNFWGHSIKLFWERTFPTLGALGGAIWGAVDNSSVAPEDMLVVSRNDWGIIDGWRREKPEYWLTKKAYSPVRIEDRPLPNPGKGELQIPIRNWFDHTNLKEITVEWRVGPESGKMKGPDVEPHRMGLLRLPARLWKDGEVLNLKFFRMGDLLVDEYNLPINPPPPPDPPVPQGPAPEIREQADRIVVQGRGFELSFSRETGLMTSGVYQGTRMIESGPYLNLVGQPLGPWVLKSMRAALEGPEAVVYLTGSYGAVEVRFQVRVDGSGLITTRYTLDAIPPLTRQVIDEGYRRDVGGYWETGVAYVLTSEVDRLAWRRKGLWSAYPEDHIGRNAGVARREGRGGQQRYGEKPSWPWAEDEKEFILFGRNDAGGRGTMDFRSTKENIFWASAILRGSEKRLQAVSDGKDAVRMEVEPAAEGRGRVRFIINNEYNVPNLAWGNWVKDPIVLKPGYTNQVRMRFTERD